MTAVGHALFPLMVASGDVSVHFGGRKCCCCFLLFFSLEQLAGLYAVENKKEKKSFFF